MTQRSPTTVRSPYRDPRWLALRAKVLDRDGGQCQLCKSTYGRLVVHHRTYTGGYHPRRPWVTPQKDLVTLCHRCHERLEAVIRRLRSQPESVSGELLAELAFRLGV